ncbi:alpha/beta hydrolase [Peribacillus frigoritolerans]|uniref:alpha/beta hydrolase n=1 Tax=Peribacillus TaxID=2675229 RepID=UPI0006AC81FD|nr:alpha/beta hydrolase [Peribacillus frigoritolerans]KOR79114.1 carboxylesterase [Bacillus sp. FJAT-21352]KOR82761.1 carboxylesterase [Bacillus sp. FJAT-22058]AZV59546.1 alpha/beta hydrolase [Peribacillus frigoritolerans]MCY9141202.1 alpha/beta hydrolase [Peribacillus frigoritolerans]MDM5313963.1 alpha/beta hydrolase [Peribacillus frigoritolerans]
MKHIFQKGSNPEAPLLLLLHGTGGTETDLLPLSEMVSPGSSVLSVRGNVLENGMPRYFRRLAEGVFDEEDLIFRTKELYDFLELASGKYDFDRDRVVALGYSNGANIAASLLFHYEGALQGAILHHPMVPRRGITLPSLSDIPVFIAAGKNDPICPAAETDELNQILLQAGAAVNVHWENYGHQLTRSEVDAASSWFQKNFL